MYFTKVLSPLINLFNNWKCSKIGRSTIKTWSHNKKHDFWVILIGPPVVQYNHVLLTHVCLRRRLWLVWSVTWHSVQPIRLLWEMLKPFPNWSLCFQKLIKMHRNTVHLLNKHTRYEFLTCRCNTNAQWRLGIKGNYSNQKKKPAILSESKTCRVSVVQFLNKWL